MQEVPPILAWAVLGSLAVAVAVVLLAMREVTPAPAPVVVETLAGPPVLRGSWTAYVAPARVCAGGDDATAAPGAQEATMRCLVDYARQRRGLAPVVHSVTLDASAAWKAADIVRCATFAHDPCGTGSAEVFDRVRYGAGDAVWAHGENLALVSAAAATPRYVLNGWLNSDGHRENLFRADWTEGGLALVPSTDVGRYDAVNVWASHFGYRR